MSAQSTPAAKPAPAAAPVAAQTAVQAQAAVPTQAAVQTQPAVAAQPIRFRAEGGSVADSATGVLLVLALLLGGCLAALLWAKKKGWLDRWIAHAGAGAPGAGGLRVEQSLRLSPRTVLYRVGDGRERYLVVESTVSAQLTALDGRAGAASAAGAAGEQGDE